MSQVILIIDPQNAFCSLTGSLAKAFGARELVHIRERLAALQSFLLRPQFGDVVYVRSEYVPGQFTGGNLGHAYSQACVPSNGDDCEWSLPSHVIDRGRIITKREESAASVPELLVFLSQKAEKGCVQVLIGGFLTTSCVRKTALDLRVALPLSVQVRVAENLTASRCSNYVRQEGQPSRHERSLLEMALAGISISHAEGHA